MVLTMPHPDAVCRSGADPLDCLPLELRFLVDFCRPVRRVDPAPHIDWTIIALGLERHGLSRLVPHLLSTLGLVPPEAADTLREIHRHQATLALSQLNETVRLSALLDQQGLRFILIKGIALSMQLYGRPGLRASKDIDVLIEASDVSRVDALLREQEYVCISEGTASGNVADSATKEIVYRDKQRGMMVEVHIRLTENTDLYATNFEEIWQSRDMVALGGHRIPVMARAQLSTYLCVHGTGHCWSRLMWLLDIVALTPSRQACEAALADARRHGLEPVLLHSLWMLHHWLGHDVPETILAQASASRPVRLLNRMAARFHQDKLWYTVAPLNSWRRFVQTSLIGRVVRYHMKSGTKYWQHQLALEMVSPSDRAIVALPPRLAWAYVIVRPLGWIIRRFK